MADDLVRRLDDEKLTLNFLPTDGNCLPRAVARSFLGDQERHPEARRVICDYIAAHADDFKGFVEDEDVVGYVAKMRKDGEWLDQHALLATTQIYNTRIVVHHDADAAHDVVHEPRTEEGDGNGRTVASSDEDGCGDDEDGTGPSPRRLLRLAYSRGEHYDLVVPAAEEPEYADDRRVLKNFSTERQAQDRSDRLVALALKRDESREKVPLPRQRSAANKSSRRGRSQARAEPAATADADSPAKAKVTAAEDKSCPLGSSQEEEPARADGRRDQSGAEHKAGRFVDDASRDGSEEHRTVRGPGSPYLQIRGDTADRACDAAAALEALVAENKAVLEEHRAVLAENKTVLEEHRAVLAENKAVLAELRAAAVEVRKRGRGEDEDGEDADALSMGGASGSKRVRRVSGDGPSAAPEDEAAFVCRRRQCNSIVHESESATRELIRKFARRLVPPKDAEGREAFAARGGYAPREINRLWLDFVQAKRRLGCRRDHHAREACLGLKNMCREGWRLGLVYDLPPATRARRYRQVAE